MTRPTTIRYRVLALLVLASFISYVLRYLYSAAAPTLTQEYELTLAQIGWVLGVFSVVYAVFQFPAGLWVDRVGVRRAMPLAMVAWGVLTLLAALMPAGGSVSVMTVLMLFTALRFLTGIAHAPLYPLTGSVTNSWFPPGSWALPNGLSSAGLTLGAAVTAPLFLLLIAYSGWRLAFAGLSVLSFAGAGIWWAILRNRPEDHPSTNAAEIDLIADGRLCASESDTVSGIQFSVSWRQVLKDRNLLLLTLSYFCMNYVFFQLFNWVFYYLVEIRQVGPGTASLLSSLQWIMAAIGATLGALWCDRLCRQRGIRLGCRVVAITGLLVSGVLMIFGALAEAPWVLALTLALCFFSHQGTEGAYWAAAISIGGRHAGAACGVMNTGGNLVGFVNALLVPWLAQQFGWSVALGSGTGFAIAGAVLWCFIQPDRTIERAT
ncbi:MAG: MFS transporter [Gammaproteobacteria bacterium]